MSAVAQGGRATTVAAVHARRPGRLFERTAVRVSVIVICILWSLPTAGLLVSSFRSPEAISTTGWWEALLAPFAAGQWSLGNYQAVVNAGQLPTAFINSFVITIPATIIPITMAAFAAYAFAWMRFPGRRILFVLVIALIVLPLQMALVPVLRLYTALDMTGTFLGTWLAHTAFGLPLATFLLYNYISQLPGDLFESAAMDGATHMQVFRSIVLPLSTPALAAFAIFQFLWVWNDLLVSLVYLGTDSAVATLPVSLSQLVGSRGEAWYILTAAAFVSMIVPLLVFLALQRYFVRGIVAGSVKG